VNQAAILKVLRILEAEIKSMRDIAKSPECFGDKASYYQGNISGMEYAIRTIERGLKK